MLPHLGAGAGQAIEDALMLARLLGHPQTNKSNIEVILFLSIDVVRQCLHDFLAYLESLRQV